ncbi:MAG: glucose-1-phosphate cytidylyltransferase [Candidatus Omnitrophica bacterium]|nr:glucose-1-phosphate cytidylyltransferase [Candidatus Omnitrophota bacterium]
MKVVILCGGLGTRLGEETEFKPKPMIEIGGRPILWHIMKIFSHYGFDDFIVCLGYKGYVIKEYFTNYFLHQTDVTIDLSNNRIEFYHSKVEPWKITLVDTGEATLTGGRIKRIQPYVAGNPFMMTYGDGVCDVNLHNLLAFHQKSSGLVTLTAVQPSGRFGALGIDSSGKVCSFVEKPRGDGGWINGGFAVLEPGIFQHINGDHNMWEKEPLEALAKDGNLKAFKHYGFWKAMDTLRDKNELEELWQKGEAPWRIWNG